MAVLSRMCRMTADYIRVISNKSTSFVYAKHGRAEFLSYKFLCILYKKYHNTLIYVHKYRKLPRSYTKKIIFIVYIHDNIISIALNLSVYAIPQIKK